MTLRLPVYYRIILVTSTTYKLFLFLFFAKIYEIPFIHSKIKMLLNKDKRRFGLLQSRYKHLQRLGFQRFRISHFYKFKNKKKWAILILIAAIKLY